MIVEGEGVNEKYFRYDDVGEKVIASHDDTPKLDAFIQKIKDKETHTTSSRLYRALVA
jgi:hypothetical protein